MRQFRAFPHCTIGGYFPEPVHRKAFRPPGTAGCHWLENHFRPSPGAQPEIRTLDRNKRRGDGNRHGKGCQDTKTCAKTCPENSPGIWPAIKPERTPGKRFSRFASPCLDNGNASGTEAATPSACLWLTFEIACGARADRIRLVGRCHDCARLFHCRKQAWPVAMDLSRIRSDRKR